ncbi:MAG: amidohydrolase [Oscillospiraceae bacterium]|nr:amidohydrolase [Oscillospiraceae bacterium]
MKTVFYGGRVYTGSFPLQQAFVVENGVFTFVGSSQEALGMFAEGDEKVPLGGAFVCAGFNDSHMHVMNYGQALQNAQLNLHTDSLENMVQYFAAFAAEHPGDGWLNGRGWNQDNFTDVSRMPNRRDLDRVSSTRPVCAVRCCGHALAVNTAALQLLGITAQTPCPDGGEIGMENGEPNGLFFDNAMELVSGAMASATKEQAKDMIRAACRSLNSYGVTSAQSDDYFVAPALGWRGINEAFAELEAAGELTVRVCEQANFDTLQELREFVQSGERERYQSDRFKIGPLKMLGDGALGARTAYLSRPYADDPTTQGLPVFTQQTFDEMIGYANEQGMAVAIHAIGDGCLDRVLAAIEKALAAHPRTDHRHGIVHCQVTRPDQLKKIAELGLHIYAQSIFLDYDTRILTARVGEELAASSYCWKTLLDAGCRVSNGTDCPVELPFALGGIQCAVTRRDLAETVAPHLPAEAFSVKQALDSYTEAGAYASFEEHKKGRIAAGMLADFVVLDEDIFSVEKNTIKDIAVLATYVGGEKVYAAK